MGGYELWEHLKSELPGITNDQIAQYAGTTGPTISNWKSGRQPSFQHVQELARNIEEYPRSRFAWGLDEHRLMRLAGYEIAPNPVAVREAETDRRFMADWSEVTVQVAQLDPSRRQKALKAVREVLGS